MNIVEVAHSLIDKKIFLPGIGFIYIENLGDWRVELGEAANSKRLWLNSLVSAHASLKIAVENNDATFARLSVDFVTNYLRQYDTKDGVFIDAWRDEHAVANRLFVLTAFLHETAISDLLMVSQIDLLYHANRHAIWLMDDANYAENNHGIMMDLALAQFGVFLKNVDPDTSRVYLSVASRRLEMMLDKTFDSQGCCTENSPSYHFVNYALFSSVEQFYLQYMDSDCVKKFRSVLEKVRQVGHLFLRPDRTIPLVGDSEAKLGTFFPTRDINSQPGIGYYPEAGFFVANLPDAHLTFKAGGQNFSHRHVDDLSFTLWVGGRDFVVDGGMYNYDISNRMRRQLISSRAHSGFYLESAGDVRFANFANPSDMSNFVSKSGGESGFSVVGRHNLSPEAVVTRGLTFLNGKLRIVDEFQSDREQKWRYQLVLHPDVELRPLEVGIGFCLHNVDQKIIWRIANLDCRPVIESGNYSSSFGIVQSCKVIVISGQGGGVNLATEILFPAAIDR